MTREFIVDFIDWQGRRDTLFCSAVDAVAAREFAYWTLGDLIDIISVKEFVA